MTAGPKKTRIPIPVAISSSVLYEHHHTCCVCAEPHKPVQIHHVDENPANNDLFNLAVLCLVCHDQTQVRGGFGRKLTAPEVIKYRDAWLERVKRRRSEADKRAIELTGVSLEPSVAESHELAMDEEAEANPASEAAQIALVHHLPNALTALYAAERDQLDNGAQQEQTHATVRTADALEVLWLSLVRDYPDDRFPPNPKEYVSQFRADRGSFHWGLAHPNNEWPGSMVVTMVGWSVLRDMERLVEDTVRALTRFSHYDFAAWQRRWNLATFDFDGRTKWSLRSVVDRLMSR